MNDFQLQIWDGKQYKNDKIDAAQHLSEYAHQKGYHRTGGYRVVNVTQRAAEKRSLMMNGRANWKSGKGYSATEISRLAELAADHYRRVRGDSYDLDNPVAIDVFPVLPSGRGISADFRLALAGRLTGNASRSSALYPSDKAQRIALERQLGEHGYRFVEINNPEDYS